MNELNFKNLLESSGMSMAELANYFEIPYKTMQKWIYENREPHAYLLKLMFYKLEKEGKLKK